MTCGEGGVEREEGGVARGPSYRLIGFAVLGVIAAAITGAALELLRRGYRLRA